MKSLKIMIALMVGVALFFTGCEDLFDDVEPATSVSGEEALSSPEGVEAIRASMYSTVRAAKEYTTRYFIAPDSFTDLLRGRPGTTRYQGYNEATEGDGTTLHLTSWGASYDIIQDANLLIGGVPEGVLEPDVEELYRGEALAMRAFAMHHLVRGYGYEPGREVDGWDAGIIIRTDPVMDEEDADARPRNTVTEVYDQIIDDLDEAAGLLEGYVSQGRMDESFVHGLAARVHLYAGNYELAAQHAQTVIDIGEYPLADTESAVVGMFGLPGNPGSHPETIFLLVVDGSTEYFTAAFGDPLDWMVNTGPSAYTSNQWVAQLPVQQVLDRYEEGDYRLGWYNECFDHRDGSTPSDCDAVNDQGWTIDKFPASKHVGNQADDMPYMRTGEIYLILAEAEAKAANDPSAGAPALNTLRNARGVGNVPSSALASMEAFEDFILDERVRELIAEGHRFWDLKRLGRDIRNPDGSTKFRTDSHRILAPLPVDEFSVNELLTQNPGYPGGN